CNRRKEAIDICLRLNHWRVAYELAKRLDTQDNENQQQQQQQQPQHLYLKQQQKKIDNSLSQTINHFIEQGRIIQAEAQKAKLSPNVPPLHMKKLYVLFGLLMEQYYEQSKQQVSVKPRNPTCGEVSQLTL
ncbi:unnamed protein product, partial [Trichobilharzia regenti]